MCRLCPLMKFCASHRAQLIMLDLGDAGVPGVPNPCGMMLLWPELFNGVSRYQAQQFQLRNLMSSVGSRETWESTLNTSLLGLAKLHVKGLAFSKPIGAWETFRSKVNLVSSAEFPKGVHDIMKHLSFTWPVSKQAKSSKETGWFVWLTRS